MKGRSDVTVEDIVFILSDGNAAELRNIPTLTRGEAVHWLLLNAKSQKRMKDEAKKWR